MNRLTLVAALAAAVVAACTVKTTSPTPTGEAPPAPEATVRDHRTGSHQPAGITPIEDENGQTFQIAQGEPGDPAVVGCADGQREAFPDLAAAPAVAGCIAEWTGVTSMRTPPTGAACGDDLGACAAPADACAEGWHLCGFDGGLDEIDAIGGDACQSAGGGRFVAAVSHCEEQRDCKYDDPARGNYECFEDGWCSEPICCGSDCEFGVCTDGVWTGKTRIAIGTDQGCGAIGSSRARGVLCCR